MTRLSPPSHLKLPENVAIYFLTEEDGDDYQRLRLESLQHDADAFLSLYETETQFKPKLFANHLANAFHPPFFGFFGLFVDGMLVGYAQVADNYFEKQRHIANIYNVYISPTQRKKGYAKLLFEYIFDTLKQSQQVERLFLTCTATNTSAYRFYRKLGFQRIGIKKKAIKWEGKYDDEVEMVKVL